jgi:hypothetical protein
VTTAANDPHEPARTDDGPVDDVTIVPGLGPSGPLDMSQDPDRFDPARDAAAPTGPLDMSQDPDRFDPARDAAAPTGPLDRSLDPDRYRPPGQGQTLTDLLGEGAQEDQRDNGQWALGLLAVIAFLALASWFFGSVVSP